MYTIRHSTTNSYHLRSSLTDPTTKQQDLHISLCFVYSLPRTLGVTLYHLFPIHIINNYNCFKDLRRKIKKKNINGIIQSRWSTVIMGVLIEF